MIITDDELDRVDASAFADGTGWDPKPQGLCRGEVCVPAPGVRRDDGTVDVLAAAARLGMPVAARRRARPHRARPRHDDRPHAEHGRRRPTPS